MIDWRVSLDVVVQWTFHDVVIRRIDDAESYAPVEAKRAAETRILSLSPNGTRAILARH